MALLSIAYRNLARRKRRTALLFTLIAAILALMVIANAVFAASGKGIERSFRGSLTADLAIGAVADGSVSLFGDETPIVSEYATIPVIPGFEKLRATVEAVPGVAAVAPQVTAAAGLQASGGPVTKVFAFGVVPGEYARACPDIAFGGVLPGAGEPFILLNSNLRASVESGIGRPLAEGEKLSLMVASKGGSFRIKSAPFRGAYTYAAPNETLDRVALVDPETARYLDGYDLGYSDPSAPAAPGPSADPLAGIFDEAPAVVEPGGGALGLVDVEKAVKEGGGKKLVAGSSLAWNFILVRFAEGADAGAVKRVLVGTPGGAGVRTLSWREAAGFAAQGIGAVMAVFYVGMFIIVAGALVIVMNSLAISVTERMSEIGSMRALGATRGFVRRLFALEAFLLVSAAAVAGIAIGCVSAVALGSAGVALGNGTLAALFGGPVLRVELGVADVALHFLGAVVAGALALPYPLRAAMRASPALAMGGER